MDLRAGDSVQGLAGQSLTLKKELGVGGFGQVFLAEAADKSQVAVKTVRTSSLSNEALKAFQNELKACVLVRHPNVVSILHVDDGASASGRPPYIVMELMAGGNLRQLLERTRSAGTQLPLVDIVSICAQVVEGMKALNASIVHRDLKPENVLLTGDQPPVFKIADFGLAKLAEAATRTGTFKGWGTPAYMAPESFEDGPSTMAVDVYAAGVLFFEVATLSLPIVSPPNGDWRSAHLLTPPKDVRSLRPDLPPAFSQLLLAMLSKDPRKRPATWAEISSRLRALDVPTSRADVSALVGLATERMQKSVEAETRAAAERARLEERRRLLENAFQDVVAIAIELVNAYNAATAVGKIAVKRTDATWVEFFAPSVRRLLILQAKPVEDMAVSGLGIVRCLVSVRLEPAPQPASEQQVYGDSESMSGFNAIYVVTRESDKFGSWTAIRFEHSPLTGQRAWPRWFGLEIGALPRQLALFRAMGLYQHEERALDNSWFLELLKLMV